MKRLLTTGVALLALSAGSAMSAQTPKKAKKASTPRVSLVAQRQIAADLHWRGSNIPPAFSASGHWSR